MPISGTTPERFAKVKAAFEEDGFSVASRVEKDGRLGVMVEHATSRVTGTGRAKKAYYLEGTNYQMGWLLGRLAEEDVSRMSGEYVDKIVFAFFDEEAARKGGILGQLKELIMNLVIEASQSMRPSIPDEYAEELIGLHDGCREANPATTVTRERLWALNFGVDCVLAHIYTGRLFDEKEFGPQYLRAPIACNAFSLAGQAAGGKHFFGRDFQFPTADVFQDTACLIVHNPAAWNGKPRHAFVSQTAPGIIGSMTALNSVGTAIGVDMVPSPFCDPDRPGFNSLTLARDCMQYCASSDEVVERIAGARRGVAWIYPTADAGGGAYAVEAGARLSDDEPFPYYAYVPRHYRRRLPRRRYIRRMSIKYGLPEPRNGLVARGADYRYPYDYVEDWNKGLWNAFNANLLVKGSDFLFEFFGLLSDVLKGRFRGFWKKLKSSVRELVIGAEYSKADFSERGFITPRWNVENCPGPFYFPPQREARTDLLVATNHFISPEMRLTSMNEWTAILAGSHADDIQWRYDELNKRLLSAIAAAPEGMDEKTAWDAINFLRADGDFPDYYNPDGSLPWRRIPVHGSVSLCELKSRSLKSLYGYYGDDPVTIRLMNYV
jgi:hypothetical protein